MTNKIIFQLHSSTKHIKESGIYLRSGVETDASIYAEMCVYFKLIHYSMVNTNNNP